MNPNPANQIQLRGLLSWAMTLLVLFLISSVVPDWLINAVLILIGFALVAPIVGIFGFQWWLKRQLVTGNCPVCSYELNTLQVGDPQLQCPSCGELLEVKNGSFVRITPPGTIDVTAVDVLDVSAQTLED